MCERWAMFLQDVDYHGPARIITRNGGCFRLLFWLIIIILAWALLIYNIFATVAFYYAYPVTTHTRVEMRREMVFPAVTICNKRPIPAAAANVQRLSNETERDFYSTRGYALDALVKSCTFMAIEGDPAIAGVNCSKELGFIQTQIFPYGNCYTFNSAKKDEDTDMLKETDVTGIQGGLILEMNPSNGPVNPEHATHLPAFLHDATPGVVVQIHNPRAPADFRRGKQLQIIGLPSPNNNNQKRYDIVIEKARVFHALSRPYDHECEGRARGPARYRLPQSIEGKFKKDEESDKESPDECVKKCLREKMRDKNNCTLYDLQDEAGPNYECQAATETGVTQHDLTNNITNVDTEASFTVDKYLSECQQDCPRPCMHADYDYIINEFKASVRSTVNIYFANFVTENTEQRPEYSMHDLLQDIGLNFLILAGFSFISFMHAIEFLVDLCLYGCQRKREVADDEENQATG